MAIAVVLRPSKSKEKRLVTRIVAGRGDLRYNSGVYGVYEEGILAVRVERLLVRSVSRAHHRPDRRERVTNGFRIARDDILDVNAAIAPAFSELELAIRAEEETNLILPPFRSYINLGIVCAPFAHPVTTAAPRARSAGCGTL